MNSESISKKSCFIEDNSGQPLYMVQFHLQGEVLAMPYGHLLSCSHRKKDEREVIEILFSTRSILIGGTRLAHGFELLTAMKLKAVRVVANESELKGSKEPWVRAIRSQIHPGQQQKKEPETPIAD